MVDEWLKKNKGRASLYTHPKLKNAIVDYKNSRARGCVFRFSFKGVFYPSLEAAKKAAEKTINEN